MPISPIRTTLAIGAVGALAAGSLAPTLANADELGPLTAQSNVEVYSGNGADGLSEAVVAKALAAGTQAATRSQQLSSLKELAGQGRSVSVRVDERSGSWVQGIVTIAAPTDRHAMPQGWAFVATRTGDTWSVRLDSDLDFAAVLQQAPTAPAEMKAAYAESAKAINARAAGTGTVAAPPANTGLQFPVPNNTWFYSGSPHSWTGSGSVMSSLDVSGSDGSVRAPGGGWALNLCPNGGSGWTRIVHGNGYASDLYHLNGSAGVRNRMVSKNERIGTQSTLTCAGGQAYGNHVHFSIGEDYGKGHLGYRSLQGRVIGDHRIDVGPGNYSGGATTDLHNGNWGGLPGSRWNH